MYCSKCGKKINEGAKFCQYCGARVDESYIVDHFDNKGAYVSNSEAKENSTLAVIALVTSILFNGIGIILSIIGLCTLHEKKNRSLCIWGIVIAALELIFFFLLFFIGLSMTI